MLLPVLLRRLDSGNLEETGNFYNISAAELSDDGLYECEMDNGVTEGKESANVDVNVFCK